MTACDAAQKKGDTLRRTYLSSVRLAAAIMGGVAGLAVPAWGGVMTWTSAVGEWTSEGVVPRVASAPVSALMGSLRHSAVPDVPKFFLASASSGADSDDDSYSDDDDDDDDDDGDDDDDYNEDGDQEDDGGIDDDDGEPGGGDQGGGGTGGDPGPDPDTGPTDTTTDTGPTAPTGGTEGGPIRPGSPVILENRSLAFTGLFGSGGDPLRKALLNDQKFEPYFENNVSSQQLKDILAYFDLADRFAGLGDDGTVDIVWLKFERQPSLKGLNVVIDGTRRTPDLVAAVGTLAVMIFLDQGTLTNRSEVIPVFGGDDAGDAAKAKRRPLR